MRYRGTKRLKRVKYRSPYNKGDRTIRTAIVNLADELAQAQLDRDLYKRSWEAEKILSTMYKNSSDAYKHKYIIQHYSTIFLVVFCGILFYLLPRR